MIPPTSIDGTDITGATIDGTDVTEITVDGQTVFTSGFANYIFDDFNDNDLTRPRTGEEDGSYTAQDGTVYNDARIRPDWNTSSIVNTISGELEIDGGNNSNTNKFALSIPSSIDYPCTIEFDYNETGGSPGDAIRFGFATTDTVLRFTTSIIFELRNFPAMVIAEFVNGSRVGRTANNPNYERSGRYKCELFENSCVFTNPSGQSFTHNNTNPQRTDYNFFIIDIFDDDNSNSVFKIDNLEIF